MLIVCVYSGGPLNVAGRCSRCGFVLGGCSVLSLTCAGCCRRRVLAGLVFVDVVSCARCCHWSCCPRGSRVLGVVVGICLPPLSLSPRDCRQGADVVLAVAVLVVAVLVVAVLVCSSWGSRDGVVVSCCALLLESEWKWVERGRIAEPPRWLGVKILVARAITPLRTDPIKFGLGRILPFPVTLGY